MAPVISGTRILHDGWSRFLVAEITLEGGSRIKREIEDHGRAVAVLPYDPDRRVALLVEQFRPPAFLASGIMSLLEVPAGLLEDASPEECARREASEEAGITLHALEHVVCGWSMPGISTEQMDLYLAPYAAADRHGEGGGLADEQEDITVREIDLATLAAMSDTGGITDIKTLTLVLALRLRQPGLFAPA